MDNELWDQLAERLGVPSTQALGHYVKMTSRLIRRRHDARLAELPSSALETWADWRGESGAWAGAVRALCQDEAGELRGFRRRNEKLIAKQLRDNLKRRPSKNPQQTRDGHEGEPADNPQQAVGLTKNVDVDGNRKSSTTIFAREPGDQVRYCLACTGAANLGLRENLGSGFNELVSSNQSGVVADWIATGIPVEVAASAIYERAKAYRPSTTRRQPFGLQYFSRAVQEAWERRQSRDAEGIVASFPVGQPELDEFEAAARRLEAVS